MIILTDIPITLSVNSILKGQGVQPERASPSLFADAEKILEQAQEIIAPTAMFSTFKVRGYHHQTVELEDGGIFDGKLVARTLAGVEEVALGVCTIGAELEDLSKQLSRDDPVMAMALTGAGITALRLTSETILTEIRKIATDRGWGSGMRAQPGQEGWPIAQQQVIFDRIPAEKIDVRLNKSFFMVPQKSVSFVVGMGPDMHPDGIACDFCSKRKQCPWRIED